MPIIKVASYNIKSGQGMDGITDLGRIADVLTSLDADFISLQEVDLNRPRSFSVDQAADLARRLDMDYVFGAAITYRIGAYGNAILSRFPILKSTNHQLPAPDPKRAILEIEAEVRGKILRLFNTHMELNRNLRLRQMQEFIVPLILSANTAAVFCGDLNEGPDEAGVSYLGIYLQDSFKVNSKSGTATFPADNPSERMDYIFLNQACAALEYQIITSLASDHLPIVVKIDF